MIKYMLPIVTMLFTKITFAQNNLKIIVKELSKNETLDAVSAIIKGTNIAAISNTSGEIELTNLPNGKQTLIFSHSGFEVVERTFVFPIPDRLQNTVIYLTATGEELDELVIQSTRTTRTTANTPTRVETIDEEELDEKANMRPANVNYGFA